ncbi:hypothetical protein B0H13DRAFT_1942044, partial [Mycena leptocephala]
MLMPSSLIVQMLIPSSVINVRLLMLASSAPTTRAFSSSKPLVNAFLSHWTMKSWCSSTMSAEMPTSSNSRRSSAHTSGDSMVVAASETDITDPSRIPARTSVMNLLSFFSMREVEELISAVLKLSAMWYSKRDVAGHRRGPSAQNARGPKSA